MPGISASVHNIDNFSLNPRPCVLPYPFLSPKELPNQFENFPKEKVT